LEEPALSIKGVILNHRIPCLGLKITERFHVNIKKDAVSLLGLEIGPWLKKFKHALFDNTDLDSPFDVPSGTENSTIRRYRLGDLADQIALITSGQKVTYITDVVYNESESEKLVNFARGSDHLYIEAAFLDKNRDIAQKKYHLTAWQAGNIAGRAKVKQYTLFHHSPRYMGQVQLLEKEARKAYDAALSLVN
jgi:ribonuclease Z